MTFPLLREADSDLLIVLMEADKKFELKMVLDTGATHTTLDSNVLHLLGYNLADTIGTVEIETANGIVETQVFRLNSMSCFGRELLEFPVQIYDFLAHGIYSDYSGLLGLDFFHNCHFCLDLQQMLIELKPQ